MFIKRVCYPIHVLGPGNRIGIWLSGCNRKCPGCMSPELQTTDGCKDMHMSEVKQMLRKINFNVDGVTISGGEPFLQSEELKELVEYINENITKDIIIYTGYTLDELYAKHSMAIDKILSSISVLIDGEYIDELNDGRGLRGSSNQKIHIFRDHDKYVDIKDKQRELQTFRYNNQILVVGIQ